MAQYDRRTIFLGIAGSAFILRRKHAAIAADAIPPDSYEKFTSANPDIAAKWMAQWMRADKEVKGPLHIARFADPMYYLLEPITWYPNSSQVSGYSAVTVPVGFVTDFASIPQLFWTLLRPDGLYTYAAIVHDYLYWTQTVTKDIADDIFRFGMEDFGVPRKTILALYESVHLFGGSAWAENARLRASGERRVLKMFPEDPTVTWPAWKADPQVFQ